MQRHSQYPKHINDIRAEQVFGKNKGLELYSLRGICHLYRDKQEELQHFSCNGALECDDYFEECQLDIQAGERSQCEKTAA